MDGSTDNGGSTGIVGPESILENDNGRIAEREPIAGAIDPDAARTVGAVGTGTDDFTASFTDSGTDNTTASGTGRRGRRKGSKNKQQESAKSSIDWIQKAIFGIHEVLGTAFAPELKLDDADAKGISDAIDGIREAYEIPKLDPKTEALMNLGTVLTGIYGTRAVAIYVRKQMEREEKAKTPKPENVTIFRPAPQSPARPQPDGGGFDPTQQRPYNGPG